VFPGPVSANVYRSKVRRATDAMDAARKSLREYGTGDMLGGTLSDFI
jgi:hypothetical protein